MFDVLGKLQFEGKPLRELLIEADPLRRAARRARPADAGRGQCL